MASLAEISGIGIPYQVRLAQSGILSTDALLQQGSIPRGRKAIAVKAGVSERLVLEWVSRADLRRIARLSEIDATLVERAGVKSIPQLALSEPDALYRKLLDIASFENSSNECPSRSQAADWVAQARRLQHIVVY